MSSKPDDSAATDADRRFIRHAYEIARSAAAKGNHPFGSLLVRGGEVLAEAENAVVTGGNDVTLHAETCLVSVATRRFDRETLRHSTLYTSTEPCVMCAGAIHWAGIGRVVYGAAAPGMSEILGETWHGIRARETFERMGSPTETVGPVLEDEGLRIHQQCWPERDGV